MRTGRVSANGVDFTYLQEGPADGPLALCLHGFPDHAPTFERLLADLSSAGFHAVAPWMRGYHPTSAPAGASYHTTTLALDALALADELAGHRDAILVGHDWGAVCAYTAVAYRPERFRKLVTMAVPPPQALASVFLKPAQLKRSWYMFFFQSPLAETAVRADDFAFIDMLWADWSPGWTAPRSFMRDLKACLGAPGSLEAAIAYYRATLGGSPDPNPPEVRAAAARPVEVPTLYLHGANDGCMGAELLDVSASAASSPKGLEHVLVAGAGHFLHLERPDEVCGRIVSFVSS